MSNKKTHKNTKRSTLDESMADTPKKNRRRLLKCAVAVPVVMTLHSGAALAARTSNYVPAEQFLDQAVKMKNNDGDQLLCVHPDPNMTHMLGDQRYDVGDPAMASLGKSGDPMDMQAENCQNVGGIMISATAYSSIQDKLVINVTTL